jgi:dTDP-4-amino-4,6-dideoxygalactose transaminase
LHRWKVPLSDVDIGEEEILAVGNVLRSRWLSMGAVTAEFERQFANYVGVKYAFGVANCTAALHLASLAVGLRPCDRVICPSLTFVAAANAIRYVGAVPNFADITSVDNLNISPEDIERKLDDSTRAISVVHYGGYPCDMDAILSIARKHNLAVIEDAAHAVGASLQGRNGASVNPTEDVRHCGTMGDIGCFSFFANKNLATGEGGMIVTNRDDLAGRIKSLRSHGMTTLTWDREHGHSFSYDVVGLGYNYRIDEIRSAMGLVQLRKLDANNHKRGCLTRYYMDKLRDVEEIHVPFQQARGQSSYHIFPIVLNHGLDRSEFMNFMKANGIQTSIHYPPIHGFSAYRGGLATSVVLPLTEGIKDRLVTLPLYSTMREGDVDLICRTIKNWLTLHKSESPISLSSATND